MLEVEITDRLGIISRMTILFRQCLRGMLRLYLQRKRERKQNHQNQDT